MRSSIYLLWGAKLSDLWNNSVEFFELQRIFVTDFSSYILAGWSQLYFYWLRKLLPVQVTSHCFGAVVAALQMQLQWMCPVNAQTSSTVIRGPARGTGRGTSSHFMWRVKRRNRVVSHSWTPIFLITQWFCHPLMKESTRMPWKAGDSRCCGRLDFVCIRYKIHSQGSLLALPLCHRTGTRLWTKPRALLCSQQAGSWGWNGFHTVLQTWGTRHSSAHLHCTLAVCTGFFFWLVV